MSISFLNCNSNFNKIMIENGFNIYSKKSQVSDYIIEVKVKSRFRELSHSENIDEDYYHKGCMKLERNTNLCRKIYENLYSYSFWDMLNILKVK